MSSLSNKELTEKYDDATYEQFKIFRELFMRYRNKELSEAEWVDVQNVGTRRVSDLFDEFISPDISNEKIRDEIYEAVKVVNDKNR